MVPKLNAPTILAFLTVFSIRLLSAAQFCASDGSDEPAVTDPNFICNDFNFSTIKYPKKIYNSSDDYPMHYCDIIFSLDLDQTITSEENYSQVIQFISETTSSCLDRGVGYKIFAWPMFNHTDDTETVCCDQQNCIQSFGFMKYSMYVGHFDSLDPVQPVTQNSNFSYTLIYDMKRIGTSETKCLYNNYVLITNRLFNISTQSDIIKELNTIENYGCITFTVVAVGNAQITTELIYDAYKDITLNTFVVPNFNCLDSLNDCIKPCGTRKSQQCSMQEFADCPLPTTTLQPTTTTTVTTPKPTANPEFYYDWHIIYLFAISNRTTSNQFNNLVKYISDPLKRCENQKIVIRFLARNNSDSDWITDLGSAGDYLSSLKQDEVLIDADDNSFISGNNNVTVELVFRATSIPLNYSENGVKIARIYLLTDFVSDSFVSAYNRTFLPILETYEFSIIAFTEDAYNGYKNQLKIKPFQVINDAGYGDTKELGLCDSSTNVTTIMFIIIGTCSGAMFLLILLTVLYRQKYMWMRKLKRFKTSHVVENDDNDMIDYWELPSSQLMIKNEKLGHGAYGDVFKGKITGVPPAIQRFNRSEVAAYADCECAVKMLRNVIGASAKKQEFLHEIELMKNIGFNEHIVNMLGCVTTSQRSCLVLEYCTHRDLLKYVKERKCDLEISRSVDETFESHKEFLNFAWQISQGMRFLVDKNIIHRDLAARNILITEIGGMKSAKVSDFGLAISLNPMEHGSVTSSDRLPIKWLALECLEKSEFTHKSDVWSFGIVIFEMYSLGETPYSNIEPTELIAHLKSGQRPRRPLMANDKIAEIMASCWDEKPLKRPDFDELSGMFASELEQSAEGYGYLELIKTSEYRKLSEASPDAENNNESPRGKSVDMIIPRNRSVTCKGRPKDFKKHGRDYSFTTHYYNDEPPNGKPRLAKENGRTDLEEKEKSSKNRKSYLNLLPSLNQINPFSKENELKKTFKRKFYSRRGSVPY